jgi:hypothetical protein
LYFTELGNNAYYGGNVAPTANPDSDSLKAFIQGSLQEIRNYMPKVNGEFFYNWTLNSSQGAVTTGGPFNVYTWDFYCKPDDYSLFYNYWSNVGYQQ